MIEITDLEYMAIKEVLGRTSAKDINAACMLSGMNKKEREDFKMKFGATHKDPTTKGKGR